MPHKNIAEIVFEKGDYWIKRATFGRPTCLAPARKGFEVYRVEGTHSVRVASIGFEGDEGLRRAKAEIERRISTTTVIGNHGR
jgi:hypothetical protein